MVNFGMQEQEPISDQSGLAAALKVAKGEAMAATLEPDAKMLGFFLREGECTAEISDLKFSVYYSWRPDKPPSNYYPSLASRVIRRLMELGDVQCIDDEAIFQVGPGRTGEARYVFDFKKKWVRIQCEEERIVIKVRDEREALHDPDPKFVVRCERCSGVLQTPLAKQCLHCGYDWH